MFLAFGPQINANTAERLKEVPLTLGAVSSNCAHFESLTSADNDAKSEKMRKEGDYDMPDIYPANQNAKYALSRSTTTESLQQQTNYPHTYPNVPIPAGVDNRAPVTAAAADEQRALEQMRLQHAQLLRQAQERQAQHDAAALAAARQAEMSQLAQSIASLQTQNKQIEFDNLAKEQQKCLLIQQQQDEIKRLTLELQQQKVAQQQAQLPLTVSSNETTRTAEPKFRDGSAINAHQFAAAPSSNSATESRDDDIRQLLAKLAEDVNSLKMNQNRTPIAVNQERQHVASPQLQQLYTSQAPQASVQPYQYQSQPQAQLKTQSKPPLLDTDTTTPKPQTLNPLCDLIIPDCTPDRAGSVTVYQLPLNKFKSVAGCTKYEVSAGKSLVMRGYATRTIIVVGATGAGKTTLINGMVNFIFGVQWQHQYRLRLVAENVSQSQAHSQTQIISAYHIPQYKGSPVPYALTIVDTPGFGDTRGINKDKEITDMMRQFFQSPDGVSEVNCIGFVTQASLPRLTPSQRYIFDSIPATFGRDIVENITLLVTFADAQDPPVLAGVHEAQIPYRNYSKFNNSALYVVPEAANPDVMDFNAMFWKLGEVSFTEFFARLQGATTKSLVLTKQVLEERRRLETVLNGLLPQVKAALNQMEEQRKQIACLEQHRVEIKANADFEIHRQHVNNPYKFELNTEDEVRTSNQMMSKYQTASRAKLNVQQVIEQMTLELAEIKKNLFKMILEARSCLLRLNKIAMKQNPLTMVDYLDQLIESEKQEMKPGFKDRLHELEDTKKKAELLERIVKPGQSVDQILESFLNSNSSVLSSN